MKKSLVFLVTCLVFCFSAMGQKVDSIVRELERQKIFEKVAAHDKLVERLEWTNPSLLIPGVVGLIGLAWLIFMQFWGIQKKVNAILKSDETKKMIDNLVEDRFIAIAAKEDTQAKAKPVYLVFAPGTSQRELHEFLAGKGFTSLRPFTSADNFTVQPNDVVVLANEHDELFDKIEAFVTNNESLRTRARFFYFNATNNRWEHPVIRMTNFANSKDTLASRLLETLKK